MLEAIDFAACSVLFAYCFAAAWISPGRGMSAHKAVVCILTIAVGLPMMAPWQAWLPEPQWPSVALHACLAAALIVWRREAMCFLRTKFQLPDDAHPLRRATDWR